MNVPLIDLAAVHAPVRDELIAAFTRMLDSSSFIGGSEVEDFENELAEHSGVAHAVGVGSGTAALQLTLMAAGIGAGDEVILPANSFFATAEAVMAAGATPVLVDVNPNNALIDPDAAASAITERTAAVIPVHLYGQPADMDRIQELGARHGLFVLEDAAQAIGATWDGMPAGSLGAAGAISFYPGKNLGALGDAGAVTTNDEALARRVRRLRSHGEETRHHHVVSGFTERLDSIQAAFLRIKLRQLPDAHALRMEAVAEYHGLLQGQPGVGLLETDPRAGHVHHLMVVLVDERDRILAQLNEQGIGAAAHYPTPIHLQPGCFGAAKEGDLPHAEALCRRVLSLPLYPGLNRDAVRRCAQSLLEAL